MSSRPVLSSAVIGAAVLFCSPVHAQLPEGHVVVSSGVLGTLYTGTGGLWIVDPSNPIAAVEVQGLPPRLTATGSAGFSAGPGNVIYDPEDGALIVDDYGVGAGAPLNLTRVILGGSSVAALQDVQLATTIDPNLGGIADTALLPDGGVVFTFDPAAAGTAGEAMAGATVGVATFAPAFVSPVLVVPTPTGASDALAVDAANNQLFIAYNPTISSGGGTTIVSVPLPLGGTATTVAANFNGTVVGMDVLPNGNLAVAVNGGLGVVQTVDVATGAATADTRALGSSAAGLRVEHLSGDVYYLEDRGASAFFNPPPRVVRLPADGSPAVALSEGTPNGWGRLSGLDVNEAVDRFGSARTVGQFEVRWNVHANPAGAPRVGNANWSLGLLASGATQGNLAYITLAPPSSFQTIAGVQVFLDVTQIQSVQFVPGGTTSSLPAPIPNNPNLIGLSVYGQAVAFNPDGSLSATLGARVTIQP